MGISTVLDTQVLATSGADGDVLTQQADGTYLAETPSAGGSPGGSTGEIQYNDAGAFGGTVALVYAASGTHFTVTAQAATDVPVVVKGAASQTANLQEWQDSSGTSMLEVTSSGGLLLSAANRVIDCDHSFGNGLMLKVGGTTSLQLNTNSIIIGNNFTFNWNSSTIPKAAIKQPAAGRLQLCTGTLGISNGEPTLEMDNSSTAGDTKMLLWDVDSAALVRVSVGADDSGGAGFKVLRIPN